MAETNCDDALATGLLAVDAGRRVGWAKAFDARRHVESLEQEVSQMRSERVALRRAYSRLLGFVQNIPAPKSEEFEKEISGHLAAERSFRHPRAWAQGIAAAKRHKILIKAWSDEDVATRENKKSAKQQATAQLIRDLQQEAERVGHVAMFQAVLATEFIVTCSCGETATVHNEHRAFKWQNDHYSMVLYGKSYADRKKELFPKASNGTACEICGCNHQGRD